MKFNGIQWNVISDNFGQKWVQKQAFQPLVLEWYPGKSRPGSSQ